MSGLCEVPQDAWIQGLKEVANTAISLSIIVSNLFLPRSCSDFIFSLWKPQAENKEMFPWHCGRQAKEVYYRAVRMVSNDNYWHGLLP